MVTLSIPSVKKVKNPILANTISNPPRTMQKEEEAQTSVLEEKKETLTKAVAVVVAEKEQHPAASSHAAPTPTTTTAAAAAVLTEKKITLKKTPFTNQKILVQLFRFFDLNEILSKIFLISKFFCKTSIVRLASTPLRPGDCGDQQHYVTNKLIRLTTQLKIFLTRQPGR